MEGIRNLTSGPMTAFGAWLEQAVWRPLLSLAQVGGPPFRAFFANLRFGAAARASGLGCHSASRGWHPRARAGKLPSFVGR